MAALRFTRIYLLILLITSVFWLCACSGGDDQPPPNAPDVDVITIEDKPVANRWDAVGRVDSKDIVQIQSRVEGFLIERDFVEGQVVDTNKVLFKIDPKPFEASLLLAQANVEKAKAALIEAKQNLLRGQKLYDGKNISKSELDAYTSTERQAAAEVDAAKAQVYSAAINLGYTTIIAPFKGRIGRTIYSVGNLISPSSGTLATIYSIDPIYVYFTVDEKDVVTYRTKWGYGPPPNLTYNLRLPNGTLYNHQGKMDFEQPFIDKDTGTIDLRCVFPNPDNLLLSGMYVTVLVQEADKRPMPVIPQSSVQQSQTGYTVITVNKDNIAQVRNVKLGQRIDAMWVVTEGLKAGERLIVEGLQKVQVNAPVTPHLVTIDHKTGVITRPQQKKAKKGADGKAQKDQSADKQTDEKQPATTQPDSKTPDSTQPDSTQSDSAGSDSAPSGEKHSEPEWQDGSSQPPEAIPPNQEGSSTNKILESAPKPPASGSSSTTPEYDATRTPSKETQDKQSGKKPKGPNWLNVKPKKKGRPNTNQQPCPEDDCAPIEQAPTPQPKYTIEDESAPRIGEYYQENEDGN